MTGRTNYTAPTADLLPDGPAQITAVYVKFDALIGESVANAAALPTTNNFVGRTISTQDTQDYYLCTDATGTGTWKLVIRARHPWCKLGLTAAQNGGNGAYAKVTWDREVSDTFGMHDPAVNPTRITVPLAGRYRVTVRTASAVSTATFFGQIMAVNGTNQPESEITQTPTVNSSGNLIGTATLILNANDYVEVLTYTVSGQALTVAGCFVTVEYMGAS